MSRAAEAGLLIIISTLSLILLSVVAALLAGLFDKTVDNTDIFKIIGPSFQTIVGFFGGIVTGAKLFRAFQDDQSKKLSGEDKARQRLTLPLTATRRKDARSWPMPKLSNLH